MADPVNDFDIRAGLPLNEPELRGEILVFEQLFERSAALTTQNADCAAVSAEFGTLLTLMPLPPGSVRISVMRLTVSSAIPGISTVLSNAGLSVTV